MREITLTPVLTDKQLAALDNQFLTSAQVVKPITTGTIGRTEDGRIRFVFARNVIKQAVRDVAEAAIGRIGYGAKRSNRAAVRGQDGTEALWGFMEANDFRPEAGMTALTVKYLDPFIMALPFITSVAQEFRSYWPEAYEFQQRLVETASEFVIPDTGFSSLTINGNVITHVHKDDGNAAGTVSCLTQLGNFSGGHICLPRFGALIESQPGDLLVADIRNEPHGNIGPVIGERIACVSYLRGGLFPKLLTDIELDDRGKGKATIYVSGTIYNRVPNHHGTAEWFRCSAIGTLLTMDRRTRVDAKTRALFELAYEHQEAVKKVLRFVREAAGIGSL